MHDVSTAFDLRQLRYFVAVAEDQHFGRAARRIGIAQPPLSQQIAVLERKLGTRLFVRTSRQVQLTPAGVALLQEARKILSHAERVPQVVTAAAAGQSGTLSVGFSASAALSLLPRLLTAFRDQFPSVQVIMRDGSTDTHLSEVEAGVLDVAIARGPLKRSALQVEELGREPILVAAPEGHPIADRAAVDWSELAPYDFVLFPRSAAPPLFDQIIARCVKANFSPHVVQEATEWPMVSALVAAEVGLAFAPASAKGMHVRGITFVALEGAVHAEIAAAYARHDPSPQVLQLVKAAKTCLH